MRPSHQIFREFVFSLCQAQVVGSPNPNWQGRSLFSIENVFKAQKVGGDDISIVSNPLHGLRQIGYRPL